MSEYEDEDEGPKLYICLTDCFDGVRDYRKGERYALDPASPMAKYFKIPEKDKPKKAPDKNAEKEALLEEAKALGVDAKATWGVEKLKEAIAEAKAKQ